MSGTEQDLPHHDTHHGTGHGNSVAAWTSVSVIMAGFLVMSVAVALTSLWLFLVGVVVGVVGAVLGKVLSGMGFGVAGRPGS
jgi:hypothetical protein